jgi:predicted PurR-regulated permease PerM
MAVDNTKQHSKNYCSSFLFEFSVYFFQGVRYYSYIMTEQEHPFSWKALSRIVIVGFLVMLAWRAIDVFVNILISLILATAYYPVVKTFTKKLPRLIGTILAFVVLVIPFILIGVYVIPPLVSQLPDFLTAFHGILNSFTFLPADVRSFDPILYISQNTSYLVASTPTIFLSVFSAVTIFFMTFYLSLDHERLVDLFLSFFSKGEKPKVKGILAEIARVSGLYIRGNLFISLICGSVLFIALLILGVPFAAPLAIFAGIVDLLPLIGSTLGSLPAIIIALSLSPFQGLVVLIVHLIYQQTENNILSPTIYNKQLDISPAFVFFSIVIGAGLFGMLGAFLAIPVAAIIPSVVRYASDYSKRHEHTVATHE